MKSAVKTAWAHGGSDFELRFDKTKAQAQEMKEGALRVLRAPGKPKINQSRAS
jgi:hypothetical protein